MCRYSNVTYHQLRRAAPTMHSHRLVMGYLISSYP